MAGGVIVGPGFERLDRESVIGSIAALVAPPLAPDPPPGWLRDHQIEPFRRALATARRRGGAMIALPVGAGKTYLALGVAAALAPGQPVAVTAPAILAGQWLAVAGSLGIPIGFVSHEAMSRGRGLPPGPVAIVDESHRFREPGSKRYRTLAVELRGRRTLLVTATPVVNRLTDLAAQLLLAVRDDVLRLDGIPSLARSLDGRRPLPMLGRLVVTGSLPPAAIPTKSPRPPIRWGDGSAELERTVRDLDRLRLSRDRGIAALIRSAFLRALGSSPAALLGSLRRYRGLLAHATDARRAGFPVNRALIRATIAADPEQLVFWELLGGEGGPVDLALGDRHRIDRIEARLGPGAPPDPKLVQLRSLLADGPPTVVFTTAVETVRYLRNGLGGGRPIAWLTGGRAGIGGLPATRAAVLAAFDPAAPLPPGSRPAGVLITTDVAAEGLNLQRAGRVIHYDLPWTAVRLDQRDGRAVRLGSLHRDVETITFAVPGAIETRLSLELAVHRKAGLATRVGLAADTDRALALERRIALAGDGRIRSGWTATTAGRGLAAIELADGTGDTAAILLARDESGQWVPEGGLIEAAFAAVAAAADRPVAGEVLEQALQSLAPAVGRLVAAGNGAALFGIGRPGPGSGEIRLRCQRSRQDRRWGELARWERGLTLLRRGRTAGESIIAGRLAAGDETALVALDEGESLEQPLISATVTCLAI